MCWSTRAAAVFGIPSPSMQDFRNGPFANDARPARPIHGPFGEAERSGDVPCVPGPPSIRLALRTPLMKRSLYLPLSAAVILVLVTALFLRLAPISSESVDGDELFSRRVALSGASQAMNLIREDMVHPPLYYLLLKATLPDGRPATALDIRVLSLATGMASIAVLIVIGFAAPPLRGPSILAAFLLALNRMHIFYSQQARSYALFCFLVGALLLWCLFMDRYGQTWVYWLAGISLMITLLYTHYYGAFYCAAVVAPVLFGSFPRGLKIKAAVASALAFAAFLPWVWLEIAVYREKSGLSSNLAWQGLPTLFDLKMTFAGYLGIPDFRGATSLAFLIGTALLCAALLPTLRKVKPKEDDDLDFRTKATLVSMALLPPVLAFSLTRGPFRLPIFDERHVLPSILAFLLLVCYGLWRLSLRASRPLGLALLSIGAIVLSVFQFLPVYSNWPGPTRVPYGAIADWLSHTDTDFPVYTTWRYGIGEPVAFYLERSRRIEDLPADPARLPDKCIVLYRPAAAGEETEVNSLLGSFTIIDQRYYSSRNSRWGTDLLVLQKRQAGGYR